jgi:hypothetical protein
VPMLTAKVLARTVARWRSPVMSMRSVHSRRRVPTQRSAYALELGCLRRCLDDLDARGGGYGVEGGSELGVVVAEREPQRVCSFVEVDQQVPGCWATRAPVG